MRTIKELLILLREEVANRFDACICWSLAAMVGRKDISYDEYHALEDYLELYRPKEIKKSDAFWWPVGELEPRLEFLDKLIKEIDEN